MTNNVYRIDFSIATNGNITGAAFVPGTSARFSTLELHQFLQDLADDSAVNKMVMNDMEASDGLKIVNMNISA